MSREKDTEEMLIMFPENAAMAEMQYRQERFLAEAAAYRLTRAAAPARKSRLASLGQLVAWRGRERHDEAAAVLTGSAGTTDETAEETAVERAA